MADDTKPHWSDPTPEMLADPLFEAIWQCIKTWDINVPSAYSGYCGATGNHVRAVFDVVMSERQRARDEIVALREAIGIVRDAACEPDNSYFHDNIWQAVQKMLDMVDALKEKRHD